MQVSLVFLSFFILLYWVLDIVKVDFIAPVAPFFETIKNITHIFYNRISDINGIKIDFSFLMATAVILLFAWGLKFLIDYIKVIEKGYDKTYEIIKNKDQEIFNQQLEKEHQSKEVQNNQFIMLTKFKAINLKKDILFDRDINEGVKEKENEILFDFLEFIEDEFDCEKKFIADGILISFSNFDNINRIIYRLMSGISVIKKKFADENWQVDYVIAIDVYSKEAEKEIKTRKLTGLINLGLENEILCLGTFKERYSILKKQDYFLHSKGIYQIFGDNKEVFRIKSLK